MIRALAVAVIPALVLPPLLLPLGIPLLFATLPLVPFAYVYVQAIAARRAREAATLALAWSGALTIATVISAARSPQAVSRAIWHAQEYRDEMIHWIATGWGAEGNIALFLPRVLVEYALVILLAAVSVGVAALLLGSLLLGYMNGYVGWVVANADPKVGPLAAALLAWPPWPMARVVSFILAGTAAALCGYARLYDRQGSRPSVKPLFMTSFFLLALDILLKWALAPTWRIFLKSLLGSSVGIDAGGTG